MAWHQDGVGPCGASSCACPDDPCVTISKITNTENEELQALNEHLTNYVSRVGRVRPKSAAGNFNAHSAVKGLADEMCNLKTTYVTEINSLRTMLDTALEQKATLATRIVQLTTYSSESQARAEEEGARARTFAEDLEQMRKLTTKVQKDLIDLQRSLQTRDGELSSVNIELDRLRRENKELKIQLESETCLKQHTMDNEQMERQRLHFDGQVREQTMMDLENRLKSCTDVIMNMEKPGNTAPQSDTTLIKRFYDKSSSELQRYQNERDLELSHTVDEPQQQALDKPPPTKECQAMDKTELETHVQKQDTHIGDLEAKIHLLTQQRLAVEKALTDERYHSQVAFHDLERRQHELQVMAMNKAHGCSATREAHMAFRNEFDAYKPVLDIDDYHHYSPASLPSPMNAPLPTPPASNCGAATPPSSPVPPSQPNHEIKPCGLLQNRKICSNMHGHPGRKVTFVACPTICGGTSTLHSAYTDLSKACRIGFGDVAAAAGWVEAVGRRWHG